MKDAEQMTAPKIDEEWVTLPEAMRLLGKERSPVQALIIRGELTADVRGRWTFVSRSSIDRYLAAATAGRL
jgi:hypothetical protein